MPARFAKTVTTGAASAAYTPASDVVAGRVRIQNLSTTAAEIVWVAIGTDPTAAVAEGDDCIRIGPGEQYTMSAQKKIYMIAMSGTPKVLLENV